MQPLRVTLLDEWADQMDPVTRIGVIHPKTSSGATSRPTLTNPALKKLLPTKCKTLRNENTACPGVSARSGCWRGVVCARTDGGRLRIGNCIRSAKDENSFELKFKVAHWTNVGLGSATRHVLNQSMYLVSLLNERHVSLTDLGRTIFLLAFPASSVLVSALLEK